MALVPCNNQVLGILKIASHVKLFMTHPISISFPNSEFSKTYVGIFAQVTPAVDITLCLKNNVGPSTIRIYGWFLQNLGKEAVRTNMHTTVACLAQLYAVVLINFKELALKKKNFHNFCSLYCLQLYFYEKQCWAETKLNSSLVAELILD